MFSRIRSLFGTAVLFALVLGVASAERSFAQTNVEILATDLADDPAGDDAKKAYQKVNKKIEDATLTGGSMVTFPSGEFKDVGEILITGVSGTAAVTGTGAKPANPVTFKGNNTVFTGKIMFNVQNSQDIVIEGFTFRDTQVPDLITYNYQRPYALKTEVGQTAASDLTADPPTLVGDTEGAVAGVHNGVLLAPHDNLNKYDYENTGVIWLNTTLEVSDTDNAAAVGGCSPEGGSIRNVVIRDNVVRNTHAHGILSSRGDVGNTGGVAGRTLQQCRASSNVEISGNTLIGIGLGPNADYVDAAKTVTGHKNWESAIQSQKAYGWTVRDNYIGMERDGTEAAGTTWLGIKVDNAFGKTLVENNMVNNTASSGIVVGGDGSTGDNAADDAEITIRNNKVTNSRNDAYFVQQWAENPRPQGSGQIYTDGYIGLWRPGAGMLSYKDDTHSTVRWTYTTEATMTDKQIDALLKPRVWKLPTGFTRPYLGEPGESRLVSSIVGYNTGTGVRTNTGDDTPVDSSPGTYNNVPEAAQVRALKPGLEAGIELNRLTAKSIVVENNELTDNVVGLFVCPSWYCYADDPFNSLLPDGGSWGSSTPTAGTLKVPTLKANRIYDNRKDTDMPREFVRADVVNALTETNTGTGKNVLILAGNYLGASPGVQGAVNDDDLAMEDLNAGPRETVPPALPSTGGAMFTGTTVTLAYGEALDEESVPAAAAFTVMQTTSSGLSGSITVSSVAVAGMSVTLTLAEAPGSGNSLTVSYDPTKAGSGEGIGPIQDAAGNAAAAIDSRMVAAAAPMEPEEPMTEEPMTGGGTAAAAGDGGCALASGGKGGIDLGVLLPLMTLAALSFGLRRGYKESVEIR